MPRPKTDIDGVMRTVIALERRVKVLEAGLDDVATARRARIERADPVEAMPLDTADRLEKLERLAGFHGGKPSGIFLPCEVCGAG